MKKIIPWDSSRKSLSVVLVILLVLMAGIGLRVLRGLVSDVVARRQRDLLLRGDLFKIRAALWLYSEDNDGLYPYHPDGPERALYLLKPYVRRASVFDRDHADRDINVKARWDDRNKRLVGADYDYINWPNLWQRTAWRYLVVVAENTGVTLRGKEYLTLGNHIGWYQYGPDFPKEIVGGVLFPPGDP